LSDSEQRRLTEKVLVRFTEAQMLKLQEEANEQGVSLPHLMRELSLRTYVRQAS
jgi:hypothetical protein